MLAGLRTAGLHLKLLLGLRALSDTACTGNGLRQQVGAVAFLGGVASDCLVGPVAVSQALHLFRRYALGAGLLARERNRAQVSGRLVVVLSCLGGQDGAASLRRLDADSLQHVSLCVSVAIAWYTLSLT